MVRILLAFLLISTGAAAQTVQILDGETQTPIPFVRVEPNPGNPLLSDIDGFFEIPTGAKMLRLESAEYNDTTIAVSAIGDTILLQPIGSELDEFVVLPGENPAERIMEKAIANRKKNHPMGDEAFTYTSYSKFVFTMDPDALAQISDTTTDSNLIEIKQYFGKQHLFMMESTTDKSFDPPYREKEVITAYKVSGFSDPAFSTFANEMQSFNFYENQFTLLGKSYLNPLALGSIRRYLFILEDSTVTDIGTTYTIRFQPRKDKNFDGMRGWLYINTNGYALEKVIAEPAEKSESIQPKIIQEYMLVDGRKWFPGKLSMEAVFPALRLSTKLDNGYLVGKGTTYIDNIKLGADVSKQRFNAVTVETAIDANDKDSTHWDSRRKYELTDREIETYRVIDSLSEANHFEQKLGAISALSSGKIPMGYVQLDVKRLIDYRDYEGYRLGAGLETSQKLWKRATIGGYFGYGTRDKAWKYGGYASCILFPKHFVTVQGSFQEDLVERGGTTFLADESTFSIGNMYRHLYVANMEQQRKAELSLSGYITPRVKVLGSVNYQRIRLTDGYEYTAPDGSFFSGDNPFDLAEASVEVIWTIREKLMYLGTRRVSKGSRWPRISAKMTQGISGIEASQLDYQRFNLNIQQDIPIRAVGKFSYLITAGKTMGDVPLFLTQIATGTGGRHWNVSVMNTFETMEASGFFNKEQVAIFTRFTFKEFKTNSKWTSPQIVLHHAMGTGTFSGRSEHFLPEGEPQFRDMSKGYYEAGVLVDKLFTMSFLGLGIGAFYNYGPYSSIYAKDNFTVKIGISVALK